ncbi:MAG TPA: hypothetical protein VMU64_06640 [Acidimicrobiales bacterium]|nr:hypothetical protein [Acidimicrobiales bacterium]
MAASLFPPATVTFRRGLEPPSRDGPGRAPPRGRRLHAADHDVEGSYNAQEQLAIEYAERFALDHLGIDDAFFARLAQSFTDAEILDLTICQAAFLGLGQMLRPLGIDETSLLDV